MKRAGVIFGSVAILAWSILPIAWQLLTSLRPVAYLTRMPPILPPYLSLENYAFLLHNESFIRMFVNSLVVATLATLLSLAVGSLAAFALACLPLRGKGAIQGLTLASSLLPAIALLGPLYSMIKFLGLRDSWWALILTHGTFLLPLTIWTLTHFFSELPRDLYRSGQVDGLTPWQIFRRIYLPLSGGGMAASGILNFIFSWNEFLFALTFTNTDAARTVPVGIALFSGLHETPFGEIAAASIVVSAPVLLFALVFQKGIVSGLTRGAVKG